MNSRRAGKDGKKENRERSETLHFEEKREFHFVRVALSFS
jgi:hypothetical protein